MLFAAQQPMSDCYPGLGACSNVLCSFLLSCRKNCTNINSPPHILPNNGVIIKAAGNSWSEDTIPGAGVN